MLIFQINKPPDIIVEEKNIPAQDKKHSENGTEFLKSWAKSALGFAKAFLKDEKGNEVSELIKNNIAPLIEGSGWSGEQKTLFLNYMAVLAYFLPPEKREAFFSPNLEDGEGHSMVSALASHDGESALKYMDLMFKSVTGDKTDFYGMRTKKLANIMDYQPELDGIRRLLDQSPIEKFDLASQQTQGEQETQNNEIVPASARYEFLIATAPAVIKNDSDAQKVELAFKELAKTANSLRGQSGGFKDPEIRRLAGNLASRKLYSIYAPAFLYDEKYSKSIEAAVYAITQYASNQALSGGDYKEMENIVRKSNGFVPRGIYRLRETPDGYLVYDYRAGQYLFVPQVGANISFYGVTPAARVVTQDMKIAIEDPDAKVSGGRAYDYASQDIKLVKRSDGTYTITDLRGNPVKQLYVPGAYDAKEEKIQIEVMLATGSVRGLEPVSGKIIAAPKKEENQLKDKETELKWKMFKPEQFFAGGAYDYSETKQNGGQQTFTSAGNATIRGMFAGLPEGQANVQKGNAFKEYSLTLDFFRGKDMTSLDKLFYQYFSLNDDTKKTYDWIYYQRIGRDWTFQRGLEKTSFGNMNVVQDAQWMESKNSIGRVDYIINRGQYWNKWKPFEMGEDFSIYNIGVGEKVKENKTPGGSAVLDIGSEGSSRWIAGYWESDRLYGFRNFTPLGTALAPASDIKNAFAYGAFTNSAWNGVSGNFAVSLWESGSIWGLPSTQMNYLHADAGLGKSGSWELEGGSDATRDLKNATLMGSAKYKDKTGSFIGLFSNPEYSANYVNYAGFGSGYRFSMLGDSYGPLNNFSFSKTSGGLGAMPYFSDILNPNLDLNQTQKDRVKFDEYKAYLSGRGFEASAQYSKSLKRTLGGDISSERDRWGGAINANLFDRYLRTYYFDDVQNNQIIKDDGAGNLTTSTAQNRILSLGAEYGGGKGFISFDDWHLWRIGGKIDRKFKETVTGPEGQTLYQGSEYAYGYLWGEILKSGYVKIIAGGRLIEDMHFKPELGVYWNLNLGDANSFSHQLQLTLNQYRDSKDARIALRPEKIYEENIFGINGFGVSGECNWGNAFTFTAIEARKYFMIPTVQNTGLIGDFGVGYHNWVQADLNKNWIFLRLGVSGPIDENTMFYLWMNGNLNRTYTPSTAVENINFNAGFNATLSYRLW